MLDAANWTARLNELATEANVPGAALGIWSDGQEILAAHGVLNAATQVPVTTDSVFQVGSITKIWTATMIMQLVDEGLLSLDTTVSAVLPGTRLGTADVGDEVTVRHLLTHTSGIDGDVFTDTGRGDDCVERYVDLLAEVPSVFTPGATYSYCNSGYVLLGRIIEVIDGQSWDESLRERLIGPLAATQTVTLPEEAILRRAAVGHLRCGTPVHVWGLPRSIGPAGLITATAGDLLTFARLHLGRLAMELTMTGNLATLVGAEPEDLLLYPAECADSSGTRFVLRSRDDEPWAPVSFSQLADGTPCLYMSGRVTHRVS
jgi:CubicO group peptidase (beta-lactamase class C family)